MAWEIIERNRRRSRLCIVLQPRIMRMNTGNNRIHARSSVAQVLEVEPDYELDQTATRIVGGGEVLVSSGETSKRRRVQSAESVQVVTGRTNQEVDIVEGVQEFASQLEVGVFSELDSLNEARVGTEERWSVQHEVGETAIALRRLLAVTKACR